MSAELSEVLAPPAPRTHRRRKRVRIKARAQYMIEIRAHELVSYLTAPASSFLQIDSAEWKEARLIDAGVTRKVKTGDEERDVCLEIDDTSEASILAVCQTPKQRRDSRLQFRQNLAMIDYASGEVGADKHHYSTPRLIRIRNEQKARTREWADDHYVRCKSEIVSMAVLMERAGAQQFAELYTIVTGIQKHAEASDLQAVFVTLTTPPRMHSRPENRANCWDGTTPRQAQAWLGANWHRALARLHKAGIEICGIRIVEPHKDGCPHWHMMIWVEPAHRARLEEIIREGAPNWQSNYGCRLEDIYETKGKTHVEGKAKASSYLFKYISKSISALAELTGDQAAVDAWRSTWAIRAFQFFGIPSLKDWRAFRKLEACPQDERLAGAWRACKRGDAQAWIGLSGGLCIKKKDRPIQTEIEVEEDVKTLTITNTSNGSYHWENLKMWEIINSEEKAQIEREDDQVNNQVNIKDKGMVAVIPNDPRPPTSTPNSNPLAVEMDIIFGGDEGETDIKPPDPLPPNPFADFLREMCETFGAGVRFAEDCDQL